MQALGCVSEQVAVLVDRAALGRYVAPEGGQCLLQPRTAVDDQKLWLAQPALDEIVENGAPRRCVSLNLIRQLLLVFEVGAGGRGAVLTQSWDRDPPSGTRKRR
jgi:hypothetical protein